MLSQTDCISFLPVKNPNSMSCAFKGLISNKSVENGNDRSCSHELWRPKSTTDNEINKLAGTLEFGIATLKTYFI